MSTIKPFRGLRYNIEKVKDFEKVVTPPYDVINAEEQNNLLNLSPYNFTHVDFNKERHGEDEDGKYRRAKESFEEWIKKGVLVQDELPSIYFYKQDYKVMGQKYSRLGFISLLSLDDEGGESRVKPHEKTHAHAVEDRLKLTKALGVNLSPIFVCYSDKYKKVEKIFNKHVYGEKPDLDVEDKNKVRHKLWRLSDPLLIAEINESLTGQQLFIADGHHRFQVACEYRRMRLQRKANPDGTEPYNYVMTYFTNLDSKDLQILPMHRVVTKLSKSLDFLEDNFRIDKIMSKDDLPILIARAGKNEHAFGLYTKDGMKLLRLKNKLLINKVIKEGSADYKSLDASILKSFVLDKMGVESTAITYLKDFREAYEMVDSGHAQAAFILNPVQISQLKAIALNGERMPPKTTYFYPKVLSGLAVYKMD